MTTDATPSLPPFSGIDGPCPKCGMRCARAKWLVRPNATPGYGFDQKLRADPWFIGYHSGGDPATVHRSGGWWDMGPAPWWPAEWLGRECTICGYRWDEQLAEQENVDD